jgi:FkbM family methyltransferase
MLRKLLYPLIKNPAALRLLATAACLRNGTILSKSSNTYLLRRGNRQIRVAGRHLIYSMDTARHFDTYFSQVQPTQKGDRLEADYSQPRLHTLSNGLKFEITSLPEETSALDAYFRFYRPKPGDLVFDIGAYCGIFTHALSLAVGAEGKVVAFEPDPVNFECLRRNIERHEMQNVSAIPVAISDTNGETKLNAEGCLGSALSSCIDRPSAGTGITVETLTLKEACRRFGVPSFIKIDAEGAEIEIIRGASDFLRHNPIHFAIDTNHIRNSRTTDKPIEHLFHSFEYEARSSSESGFLTTWANPTVKLH